MALKSSKTLAKLALEEKFPKIDGIELSDFYQVLHAPGASINRVIGISDFGQVLGMEPMQADAVLRAAAHAGYLEPCEMNIGFWYRTVQGNALAQAKPAARILWEQIETILPAVLEEVITINREDGHLLYIEEILLFGSALDDNRTSYGYVDLDFKIQRRAGFDSEPEIRDAILGRVSEAKLRASIGGGSLAAENQDASEILARIQKNKPIHFCTSRRVCIEWLSASSDIQMGFKGFPSPPRRGSRERGGCRHIKLLCRDPSRDRNHTGGTSHR